jgi:hypothetical protein
MNPYATSLIVLVFSIIAVHGDEKKPLDSFRNDVMPALSRAGCNSGPCHGNLNGKGGFRLSLRGFDYDYDFNALTRDGLARRIDIANPDNSLLLQKATGKVSHEGSIRFSSDSAEYRALRDWIANGCGNDTATAAKVVSLDVGPAHHILIEPKDRVTIKVLAKFSDGSQRDVTSLASFETNNIGIGKVLPSGDVIKEMPGEVVVSVRYGEIQAPVRIAFVPNRPVPTMPDSQHPLDQLAFEQFKALRLKPSDATNDETFLRRAYLDTLGIIPSVGEALAFLNDKSPDKRNKLIESLLERPEFAEFWAQKWSDLLRNEEKALDAKGTRVFHQWLKGHFDADKPLTDLAQSVLMGRGSSYENPASNFYRAIRDPYLRAEAVAQVFLGVRVSCARCHNHPFDVWTQDDYHRFAAVFNTIDYRILSNKRLDDLDKHEFIGEQVVYSKRNASLPHPRGGQALPKLLGSKATEGDSLRELSDWMGDAKNPFFAKAQANRIWLHLTGRGLVDPNDDFRATNPASHPAVLEHLAKKFVDEGYRVKPLVKYIMTSKVYQVSSIPNETNGGDENYHSKALVQPLEAEQLMDSLSRSLAASFRFAGYPAGTRAGQVASMPQTGKRHAKTAGDAERFMRTFGKPERLLTCECERSDDTGMMQAFQLMTGDVVNGLIQQPENRIGKLIDAKKTDVEILTELYLATLTRKPSKDESKALLEHITKNPDRRAAWEDIAWGLINSKEFLLRR